MQPIVAREGTLEVIGGHQRLAAFESLCEEQGKDFSKAPVPVVLVSLASDAKVKALNLALNKISGDWDYDRLGSILTELKANDDLLPLTGFADAEIASLLAVMGSEHTFEAMGTLPEGDDLDGEVEHIQARMVVQFESREAMQSVFSTLAAFGSTKPADLGKTIRQALTTATPPERPITAPPPPAKAKARSRTRKSAQVAENSPDEGEEAP